MIWSIIPEELIFPPETAEPFLTPVSYLGRNVLSKNGQIYALLSTDPKDFLDERFFPGALLDETRKQ